MEFSQLVKLERARRFPSARSFHQSAKLSCAYQNYALIESGKSRPELRLALEILDALNPSLRRQGMYAWVRDQMPDRETRAFFSDFHAAPARSSNQLVGSQSIVVNRMQAKLFLLDPVYWEIATFLSAHSDQNKHPTLSELSKVFKIPARQMRKYLDELFEYGIVDRAMKAEMEYFSKLWLFIPYEDEYRPLREMNFRHAAQKFLHDDSPSKFRTTITRFLTPVQMKELEAAVLALTNHIIDLPDDGIPKDAELCTVGVFSSVRKFGNA